MIRALCLAAAASLAGCTDMASVAAALAQDPAAICVRVTTLYGSGELSRNHGCEALASLPAAARAP